jgi:two-component system, NarL family, invasion response regulator UvrY
MPEALNPIRVYMVEDHPAVRQGIRLLLELDGIQICGETETIATALEEIPQQAPSLVMIDLSLGEESGLDLLRELLNREPDLPVIVYSMFEDAQHIRRALSAGAQAYVTKREASEVLVQAIRECLAGRTYTSPRAARSLAQDPNPEVGAEALSLQEEQVFELLGQRFNTRSIAARLDLSPRTVETYYTRLLTKLHLRGMKELRNLAITRQV